MADGGESKGDLVGPYPKGDGLQIAYATLELAAGAVPIAGPVLQTALRLCVEDPLQERRTKFFAEIAAAINRLWHSQQEMSWEALSKKPEFISLLLTALQMAEHTHRREKLEALKNIVVNAATGLTIDEVMEQTFIGLVDRFTSAHIRLLRIFGDIPRRPAKDENRADWAVRTQGELGALVDRSFDEGSVEALKEVEADLEDARLIHGSLVRARHIMEMEWSPPGLTERGRSFLQFISWPSEERVPIEEDPALVKARGP